MLYSRFLLVIYCIGSNPRDGGAWWAVVDWGRTESDTTEAAAKFSSSSSSNNVYMSIPISQFSTPPLTPLVSIGLFSTSVSLFLLCKSDWFIFHLETCIVLISWKSKSLGLVFWLGAVITFWGVSTDIWSGLGANYLQETTTLLSYPVQAKCLYVCTFHLYDYTPEHIAESTIPPLTNIILLNNHNILKLFEALGEDLRSSECLGTSVIRDLKTLPVYLPFAFYRQWSQKAGPQM